MKWKKGKNKIEPKPFLVLPLELYDLTILRKRTTMVKKKPNLKLIVRTNGRAGKENDPKENDRPLTATLEKPQVLDIRFLGKIDMSMMRKEFLTMSNLCRLPLTRATNAINTNTYKKSKVAFKTYRKRTLKKAIETEDEMSSSDAKVSSRRRQAVSHNDSNNNRATPRGRATKLGFPLAEKPSPRPTPSDVKNSVNNNNSIVTGTPVNKTTSVKSTKLPQSCTSCGRADQPERFHTHPPRRALAKQNLPLRKQVSRPLKGSLNPDSCEMNKVKSRESKTERNSSLSPKKIAQHGSGDQMRNAGPKSANQGDQAKEARPRRRGPRTLICYLCGREYGTASLQLHEPKCIEKWQRENAKLPRHLRRPLPQKPEQPLTSDEWNDNAWKTMQESLVPCKNCSRTFLPDRLEVHQRSCKTASGVQQEKRELQIRSRSTLGSKSASPHRGVECPICRKMFGTQSIKIHQESCQKKLELQNNNYISSRPGSRKEVSNQQFVEEGKVNKTPEKRPHILPCYLCGRPFSVSSIYIHEPQCLKKWKIQNEKLPPSKRRPEPIKPDIKFKPTGEVDFEGTFNRIWDNHLSELIPCKSCGRTFFPDRIEKHESACSGNGVKLKSIK